jgi:hypothetical protein
VLLKLCSKEAQPVSNNMPNTTKHALARTTRQNQKQLHGEQGSFFGVRIRF